MERYRVPSYVYAETHPEMLMQSVTGVAGFLDLGKQVWEFAAGTYGFIDVQTGIPLRQLGGIQELRRADPRYRLLPDYLDQAYQRGVSLVCTCDCYEDWQALTNGGILLTLAPSPLDWFAPSVQERRKKLEAVIEPIALDIRLG
jgi:hypothetical protein